MKQSTLSLKLATQTDIDNIVLLSRGLVNDLPFKTTLSEAKVRSVAEKVINGDKNEAVIILACQDGTPVGVLGCARIEPLFCSPGDFQAVELLMYVRPEYREYSVLKQLIDAYKFWAQRVGCSYITYSSYKNGIEMNRIRRLK